MPHLNEKCGVFGVYGKNLDVARITFFGLFALQHRGQESSGIAVADGTSIACHKDSGLVAQVYTEVDIEKLKGYIAIGHNRYSTSEGTGPAHAQPVMARDGAIALAHNGNLPSTTALKNFLNDKGIAINGSNDSELMAKAVGYFLEHGHSLGQAVKQAFPLFTGAFSLLVMTASELAAVRDEYGVRPLSMGSLENGAMVFASETCALKTVGAKFEREVAPGEMVVVSPNGLQIEQLAPAKTKMDIFEFVYFARPDSEILGKSVYEVRKNCGKILAREKPLSADVVVPVPETAIPVALGYAQATGIPLEMALIKNRYIHRTFIRPDQQSREKDVQLKLNPIAHLLNGKRVVLMDDSIVRGTTSRKLVKTLFRCGAREVHFLVSSPPVRYPDFYGIDTPKQEKLIAATKSVKEIKKFLGATSLSYLSLAGLIEATGLPPELFCTSCFTGDYPIDLRERKSEVKKLT